MMRLKRAHCLEVFGVTHTLSVRYSLAFRGIGFTCKSADTIRDLFPLLEAFSGLSSPYLLNSCHMRMNSVG